MSKINKILENLKKEYIFEEAKRLDELINFSGDVVYVGFRGIGGLNKTSDTRFIIIRDLGYTIYSANWYSDVEDRRKDIIQDMLVVDKDEFYDIVDNYYEVWFEELTIADALQSNRNFPVEELERKGIVEEYFDYGEIDRFREWVRGKEYGREYKIFVEESGEIRIEKLHLKMLDLDSDYFSDVM